jgi:hypothetical protein
MPDEAQAQDATSTETFDFDTWLGEQPEHVKKGYEGKTQGLHSALEKERTGRQDLSKELKRLEKLAGEGSEAQKALGEMSTRLEQAERERDFIRDASRTEIGCANPDLAYLVAVAKNLFTRSGDPDWAAIKTAAPELFARKVPPGNAGSGNGSPPAQKADMNSYIRAASGRG